MKYINEEQLCRKSHIQYSYEFISSRVGGFGWNEIENGDGRKLRAGEMAKKETKSMHIDGIDMEKVLIIVWNNEMKSMQPCHFLQRSHQFIVDIYLQLRANKMYA